MDFSKIVRPLLEWYGKNARTLPWREDVSPYRVWISEIMCQQTRIDAVKPYFERFVREIPDIPSLAAIPEEQLLKLWEGLGYYSRAKNLKKAACILMRESGGQLPSGAAQLKKLPGIGEYTAGAIASIAYGLAEPAVDGNVLRVAARLAASREEIHNPAVKKKLYEILRGIYPEEHAGAFTQSLMELGATVCVPNGQPRCAECPLAGLCEGFRTGAAAELPVKSPKAQRKTERRTVFLILCGKNVAVRKRPKTGLLAGLWEFPNETGTLSARQAEKAVKGWGLAPQGMEPLPQAKHVFSHLEWHMTGYLVRVPEPNTEFAWPETGELFENYAVPSAFRVYLRSLRGMT